VIGDNHFKCGGDDTTVAWLCLFLHFLHGSVNEYNTWIPFQTSSIGTDGMNGSPEGLSTTVPLLVMIIGPVT